MGPDSDTTDDLRSTLESALGGGESEVAAPESPAPAAPDAPAEAQDTGSGRDALGRFLPKKTEQPGAAAAPSPGSVVSPGKPGLVPPAAPAAPVPIAPPAGWSPAVREHWAALPQPVQEYIQQREQQMQRWANDTAPMRQAGEAFMRAVEPHRMTMQIEGVDPLTAVQNLMSLATTLRFGTVAEKANSLAQMVKVYGVDIQALDSALVGVAPTEQGPSAINVQAEVQKALAPLMQQAQARQQWEMQQTNEAVRQELVAFAQDPEHEFISDVREIMADLIEVAERQRMSLPLQDAYDRACALHPEVSKVIMARQQGVNASKLTQAAQRAKAAAVSVRGAAPVGNPSPSEPSSIRESIEAAIEAHSRV